MIKTAQSLKDKSRNIATGDKITPREIEYKYKLMFENRTVQIMSYNIETIIAEKLETIISRGDQTVG